MGVAERRSGSGEAGAASAHETADPSVRGETLPTVQVLPSKIASLHTVE